jgi:tetratricopeptide (TPR) repeat protein
MTLMASAHERDGSLDLAGERLALAVEVSGGAPTESVRYARFLIDQNRKPAAMSVLTDARRVSPGNVEVLGLLADLAIEATDWTTVGNIASSLDQIGTEEAISLAEGLRAAQLLGQGRNSDLVAQLEQQIAEGDTSLRATALLITSRLQNGEPDAARAALDQAIAAAPDDPELAMLDANLSLALGEIDRGEAILRDLINRYPEAEAPVSQLYRVLTVTGRAEDASTTLQAGLASQPGSRALRALRAGELEAAGDIDGAIAIYEDLYAEDTNNLIIANNLASLIGTFREDEAELMRASDIARRLRDREVPAFQDTYGWIEYRRGNFEDALPYLEAAAAGLQEDAIVQYHLGMTYLALERPEDARRQLTQALDIAGDSPLPQFETARQTLLTLPPP